MLAVCLEKLLALLFEGLTFLMDHSLGVLVTSILRAANEGGGLSSEAESQAFWSDFAFTKHATLICSVFLTVLVLVRQNAAFCGAFQLSNAHSAARSDVGRDDVLASWLVTGSVFFCANGMKNL